MKRSNFVLVFDVAKTPNIEQLIAIPVDPNILSSIRVAIVRLLDTYYSSGYFLINRLLLPQELDLENLYCYKSDLTQFYYFNIIEIIK